MDTMAERPGKPGLPPYAYLPCRVDAPQGRSTAKRSRINPSSQQENHRTDATPGPVKHADGWRCCGFKRLAV
jgi:hypothetical protein